MSDHSSLDGSASELIKAAEEKLDEALRDVATAALEIVDDAVDDGHTVVVDREAWRELQTAIGEWHHASENFRRTVAITIPKK